MNENIFKDAYFGKPYKTREGDKVIYLRTFICNGYCHLVSNGMLEYSVNDNGEVDPRLYEASDVVSEWQEEINEKELDKLANQYIFEVDGTFKINELVHKAFKAGYRKALSKETINAIIELFISWNGEDIPIDIANIDSAVEYIESCLNNK